MTVKAGDSILIVAPFLDCGMYQNGDILEVEAVFNGCILAKGIENVIGYNEFVIVKRGESDERKNHLRSGHFTRNLKRIA